MGDLIIATSIWDSKHRYKPILDKDYTDKIKQLQKKKIHLFRNRFAHAKEDFLAVPDKMREDIIETVNGILLTIEFVADFYHTVE